VYCGDDDTADELKAKVSVEADALGVTPEESFVCTDEQFIRADDVEPPVGVETVELDDESKEVCNNKSEGTWVDVLEKLESVSDAFEVR